WNPAGLSLGQVLNSLVATDPSYRIIVENGTVNLMPSDSEPSLLKTRISKFEIENVNVSNTISALNALLELKEVKDAIAETHLEPPKGTMILSWLSSPPK